MGSLFMDVPNMRWSKELCAFGGLTENMLPKIVKPDDVIGPLTPQAIKDTGLSLKTKVVTGSTDTVLEVYANGAVEKGNSTVKLATAGRICVITDHYINNPMIINYLHLVPGLWYPGSGTKSCAASFRWYRDVLCQKEMEEAEKVGMDAYRLLDKAAEEIEPGSGNLFYHPYLQGENTPYYDANLCASFTGVRTFHSKAHFTRALLEGVAYSMRDSLDELERMGVSIERANVIGGGGEVTAVAPDPF
jgi:xylulokinase